MPGLSPKDEPQVQPDWISLLATAIDREDNQTPYYAQIAESFRSMIDSGKIIAGRKLPTNRELAALLSIDRSTAARAYAELTRLGYLESHVGRGSFARKPLNAGSTVAVSESEAVDWTRKFSRANQSIYDIFRSETETYEWKPDLISFAGGIPSFDSYPTEDFESILGAIMEENRARGLFEYSPAEGHPSLRRQVLFHLRRTESPAQQEELLIVSGSQQGIDIVSSVFVDPGDRVVMEDPSYLWGGCSFKNRQAECLPTPMDDEGIRLDVLESHLKRYRPKLIYVIPNFQNPTGLTMSLERRVALLALAGQYQVPILEDDFVGDLRYEGERLPSLRALPGGDKIVIHQGTFSKALCPALRLGWLVAPQEVLGRLILAKRASNLSTNSLSQIFLAEFLAKGLLEDHLKSVRETYKRRRDTMLTELNRAFGTNKGITWSKPEGGMFIWMQLPEGHSTKELLLHARDRNVSFAPGHLCFLSGENTSYLRLCFIQNDEATIKAGIERLRQAIESYFDLVKARRSNSSRPVFAGGGHTFI